MPKYQPTIGLEIHAELKTRTKMFCDSLNDPDERTPNKNVCPVCLGHPGTLPVINKKAVYAVIKVGIAVGGTINPLTKFDRKNYFYPDLPKGYQISQYDMPIVVGGSLNGVRIRRVHLEEDTGKLLHELPRPNVKRMDDSSATFVDFNRAGIPLMELVTEPDIRSADEAVAFARELQLILRYLGVSDADMEKGHMRIEPNVSVRPNGERMKTNDERIFAKNSKQLDNDSSDLSLGTKVELKNINSFKAVYDAIEFEIKRQREVLESGGKVIQETRGWDDIKKATVSQRSKEEAHDYRYFPEPDLPPFETSVFDLEDLKRHLPELPRAKQERFGKEFGLTWKQAGLLVEDKKLAEFFESAVSELATMDNRETPEIAKRPQNLLFNYLTSDLVGLLNERRETFTDLKINPEKLAHLVDLIVDGKIMSRQAKDILKIMYEDGSDPEEILEREGLHTVSHKGELETIVREVISENPDAVADYKKGKSQSIQFLVGKAMGKLKGRGNPEALRGLFIDVLTK